jgi:polyhydroxyalkanoate synthesis regulator protein
MVEDDQDFVVREAKTGEDITRSILRQIILRRANHG